MPRKIALVGTHPSGAGAPFHDPNWEIWGVSARASYFTRADRWFEIHRIDGTFDKPGEADRWRAELTKQCAHQTDETSQPVPIWMIYPEHNLGDVRLYPHEHISERFGTFFMTSSFAWMTALAIDEIAPKGQLAEPGTTFGIWGIEMEYGTEYRDQRAGFRHFLRLAEHLGVNVLRRPAGGLIYEPVPYPFWQDDPLLCKFKERNKEATTKAKQKEEQVCQVREQIAHLRGKIEALKSISPSDERIAALENGHQNLMLMLADISKEAVYWQAIDGEQKFFMDYLAP